MARKLLTAYIEISRQDKQIPNITFILSFLPFQYKCYKHQSLIRVKHKQPHSIEPPTQPQTLKSPQEHPQVEIEAQVIPITNLNKNSSVSSRVINSNILTPPHRYQFTQSLQ